MRPSAKPWSCLFAAAALLLAAAMPACAAATEPGASPAASTDRRVALVIGNAGYTRIVPLRNPRHDAEAMCASLKSLGFVVHCHLDLAKRGDLRQAVRAFAAELDVGTTALFYFAGHAVQSRGDNYLLPVDVALKSVLDIEDDGLSLAYLLRTLEDVRSAPNIVIIDACRNEPFGNASPLKLARGLARVDPPAGTVLVYATAPGGEAIDGDGRHGLFTKHLLAHLAQPGQRLSQLFDLVAQGVEDEARTRYRFEQVPYRSFSYAGALCLAGCDDQQVAGQMAALLARSEAATLRIRALEAENARLAGGSEGAASGTARARDAELQSLRSQLQALGEQARLLADYQRRIQVLERQNDEKTRQLGARKDPEAPATRAVVVPSF